MSNSFDPHTIERPDPKLMKYYTLRSLLAGPAFPIALIAQYCRYITLRYKFNADGVSMSYGVLFKKEINLTYRRLQDIHLTHNVIQRWMGLATISLQTASGNAGAEMMIEGVLEAEALRDYLYAQMRGAKDDHHEVPPETTPSASPALETLTEIRDALQVLVNRAAKV